MEEGNECSGHDCDSLYKRLQVVEFPTSFVGLSSDLELDIDVKLGQFAYLKTMCNGKLMKFEEAREISASHRAFSISQSSDHSLLITFKPTAECVSKAKRSNQGSNRFVFDLRLINITGTICCNNEMHCEIGRYYFSGQYETIHLTLNPRILHFDKVTLNQTVKKTVRILNHSSIAVRMQYMKGAGYNVSPSTFIIPSKSSITLNVTMKPTSLKINNSLEFQISNQYDTADTVATDNYLPYRIIVKATIVLNKTLPKLNVESLHKLYEKNPKYTYVGEELIEHCKKKEIATKLMEMSKSNHIKKQCNERYTTDTLQCYSDVPLEPRKLPRDFCLQVKDKITAFDILQVSFNPLLINFGRVGLKTYGKEVITINNNTKFDISLELCKDERVLYTDNKCSELILKMKAYSNTQITVFCLGCIEGLYNGTFEYSIDTKFHRKHPYCLSVGTPTLTVIEKVLKFGMITAESFVMSVPIRIYNFFNVPANFSWDINNPDTPFDIIPKTGEVPKHGCKICDITYDCKPTKSKTHDIDLISQSTIAKYIPIELNIVTRKMSIKFLQVAVFFKDIPLNTEVKEIAKLENSSREIALFYVVEPLIPGMKVEPMAGILNPKMIVSFEISVKVPCVLEFAFDLLVKINNKENIALPISGNVVEPKIMINPKNIYLPRIPSFMVTYVQINVLNAGTLNTLVEVIDDGDENMFEICAAQGQEKYRISSFILEPGCSKILFIKVVDVFRREYEMYIPFQINSILGPPNENSKSMEIYFYTSKHESQYENNPRTKLKAVHKEISYCKITGVITVPWIELSVDNFEIEYGVLERNSIEFTMTNVSKYVLPVSILINKIAPNFSLNITSADVETFVDDSSITFELQKDTGVTFLLTFHPKGYGRFVAAAVFYLDRACSIPYSNLTFTGIRLVPAMTISTSRIVCPPCRVNTELVYDVMITLHAKSDLNSFSYVSKDEPCLTVKFISANVCDDDIVTILHVQLKIQCDRTYTRSMSISFHNAIGSSCELEISFCFAYCPLTLHATFFVASDDNPFPYFPLPTQTEFYKYMDTTLSFLERWMFQQGFRRDLYPIIPDTFHAISSSLTSQPSNVKSKGMNVSYMNFMKRIAGPLMKHIRKITPASLDEPFKSVKEIYDTYRELISLLKSRGANLWVLQAKFLLSYEQFVIYTKNVAANCNADIILTEELTKDENLYNRLNKQSWMDFVLQTYKVFVMDSCFFECLCISSEERDIVGILKNWFNSLCVVQHRELRRADKQIKIVTNITTDLMDGVALISAFVNFCPFMKSHFSLYTEVNDIEDEANIVHNACLVIEAMTILRINFPLTTRDILQPNFIQMLFFSIHLYVVLPMFQTKEVIQFEPPLLQSSTRLLSLNTTTQESLIFTFMMLDNNKNNFSVEKVPAGENGKKNYLSVHYTANFVAEQKATLLIHGYNKLRVFDTYMIFQLNGNISAVNPLKKCRVTGPLYRPNKADILIASPFKDTGVFTVSLTDVEPTVPVKFTKVEKPNFYLQRLNLIDTEITLNGVPSETTQDLIEHKFHLQVICLSTQTGNSWIWFRSEIGEFFIKVTSQPRWDMAIDCLLGTLHSWPADPCSCGEACECYRSTVLQIPHKNENMVKSVRMALCEFASETMLEVFDRLIENTTGRIILKMLFTESGTNVGEISHILCNENTYKIYSRSMQPRVDRVTFKQHSHAVLTLPITLPAKDKSEKYSVTFTSECGMDVRTYRVMFQQEPQGNE